MATPATKRHIRIVFSEDDHVWFLENRDPDNWVSSEETFDTFHEVREAYESGNVFWIDG